MLVKVFVAVLAVLVFANIFAFAEVSKAENDETVKLIFNFVEGYNIKINNREAVANDLLNILERNNVKEYVAFAKTSYENLMDGV